MPTILIVEDEKKIARFLELELKHEGYNVMTAFDGRTGLDTALQAVMEGASHVTHLCNAMTGLHHRTPGLLGAACFGQGHGIGYGRR